MKNTIRFSLLGLVAVFIVLLMAQIKALRNERSAALAAWQTEWTDAAGDAAKAIGARLSTAAARSADSTAAVNADSWKGPEADTSGRWSLTCSAGPDRSVSIALSDVRAWLAEDVGGRASVAYLADRDGLIVAHPSLEVVKDRKKIGDPGVGLQADHADFSALVSKGQAASLAGKSGRHICEPVPGTPWMLCLEATHKAVDAELAGFRRRRVQITLLVVGLLVTLSILLWGGLGARAGSPRLAAASVSVALLLGTVHIWKTTLNDRDLGTNLGTVIDNAGSLAEFIETDPWASGRFAGGTPPMRIPTGIYVQSIVMKGANDVDVTGLVWQRIPESLKGKVKEGITMPEATSLALSEEYRRAGDGEDVIGWRFRASLREAFAYHQYPFDQQDIWIRLWPREFDRNVMLVPDLAAYQGLEWLDLPGVAGDIILNGWNLVGSYFDYRPGNYNLNFGIREYVGEHGFPELHFNVEVARGFFGPLVSTLIPIAVISFMMFAGLLATKPGEPWGAFSSIAGMFMTLILNYGRLRDVFATNDVLYLDYFYWIGYIAAGYVAANALLCGLTAETSIVRRNQNRIPRLLYWPLILGLVFLVTVRQFR